MFVATSKQMKAYDQALLNEGYQIEELVDKASDKILPHCLNYNRIVVVCGPGNNGADGISLAIKLHIRSRAVKVYCFGNPEKFSKANNFYLQQAQEMEVPITIMALEDLKAFESDIRWADLIVDAMFGFGLNSPVRGMAKTLVDLINEQNNAEVIAIDIPTGLSPDKGVPLGSVIKAHKTVTLTSIKQGFLNDECHQYTGEIAVELLQAKDLRQELKLAKLVSPLWVKNHLKQRDYYGYKGTYGKILHLTGCNHYRGAALLASKAAVYTGSGIVCVCSTDKVIDALTVMTPECTSMIRPERLTIEIFDNYNAILIGSGLGLNSQSEQYLIDVLTNTKCPIVIDGDGLTLLAKHLDLLKSVTVPVILTPHVGEFKRLCPVSDELDMVEKATQFALEYQVIMVLKGPNTLISDGIHVYRNITGNKAMATAGMGDVLAGIISSFLGQGYQAIDSAILGVYLHGTCGDELEDHNYTVIPSELIKLIPEAMQVILNENSSK